MNYSLSHQQLSKIEKFVYKEANVSRVDIAYPHGSQITVIYDREIIKTKTGILLTYLN